MDGFDTDDFQDVSSGTPAPAPNAAPAPGVDPNAAPAPTPAPGADPNAPAPTPAPDAMPEQLRALGYESWDQFHQTHQQQSTAAAQAEFYRQAAEDMRQAGLRQQQAPAAPAEPAGYFGFPSKAAYQAALAADPVAATSKMMQFMLDKGHVKIPGQVDPALNQRVQGLEQQTFQRAIQTDQQNLLARYPTAKDPALVKRFDQWLGNAGDQNSHNFWLTQLKQARPDLNVYEIGWKLAHYDTLKKELEAARGLQAAAGNAAGVARTSVGQPSIPAARPKTHLEAKQQTLAKWRAAGKPVSPEMEAWANAS